MSARIVISYSRGDTACAQRLASAFEEAGVDVWRELEDLPPGATWSEVVQQAYDSAEAMLLILSPESMESNRVREEWQYFLDHGKLVLPVLAEPCGIPSQLSRFPYVDLYHAGFDTAFRELHTKLVEQGVKLKRRPAVVMGMPPVMTAGASPTDTPPGALRNLNANQVMPLIVGIAIILMLIAVLAGVFGSGIFSDEDEQPTAIPAPTPITNLDTPASQAALILTAMRDENDAQAFPFACREYLENLKFHNAYGHDLQNILCMSGEENSTVTCSFMLLDQWTYKITFILDTEGRICSDQGILDHNGDPSDLSIIGLPSP